MFKVKNANSIKQLKDDLKTILTEEYAETLWESSKEYYLEYNGSLYSCFFAGIGGGTVHFENPLLTYIDSNTCYAVGQEYSGDFWGFTPYSDNYLFTFVRTDHGWRLASSKSLGLSTITAIVDKVRIRKSPSTSADIAGYVSSGNKYEVNRIEEHEGYTWYCIGIDRWVADQNGEWFIFDDHCKLD